MTNGDVAKHNTESDLWMSIRGKVYDCTKFVKFHPGGAGSILNAAGRDGTAAFERFHSWVDLEGILGKYVVGILREDEVKATDKDVQNVTSHLETLTTDEVPPEEEADLREVWDSILDPSHAGSIDVLTLKEFLEGMGATRNTFKKFDIFDDSSANTKVTFDIFKSVVFSIS